MKDVNNNNFGLLIAYIVPGFCALWGVACFSETIRHWLGATRNGTTISGFLYITIAAVGTGLIINAIRWHIVDPIHYVTGVSPRNWDYVKLEERIHAFQFLVTNQFRYYEFYSNTMCAIAFSYVAIQIEHQVFVWWSVPIFISAEAVLWSASRRTLINYHSRIGQFLRDESGDEQNSNVHPIHNDWTSRRLIVRLNS